MEISEVIAIAKTLKPDICRCDSDYPEWICLKCYKLERVRQK